MLFGGGGDVVTTKRGGLFVVVWTDERQRVKKGSREFAKKFTVTSDKALPIARKSGLTTTQALYSIRL